MDEIKFYYITDEYGCFSNFSKHPVFLDERFWKTSEHYFQACKFHDVRYKNELNSIDSPNEIAKYGNRRDLPLRKDWNDVKDDVMKKVVLAKVLQHHEVRKVLMNTRESKIVEHTKADHYWADGGDGKGRNRLGEILMEIRSELRKPEFREFNKLILPPWIRLPEMKQSWASVGYGKKYFESWCAWILAKRSETQRLYINHFPEPGDWKGCYRLVLKDSKLSKLSDFI
jgi:ribA/ribD-fused uncharacterized protein